MKIKWNWNNFLIVLVVVSILGGLYVYDSSNGGRCGCAKGKCNCTRGGGMCNCAGGGGRCNCNKNKNK